MVEEDPAADVGEQRSLAVALDVDTGVRVVVARPEELEAVGDRLAADCDEPDCDREHHEADERGAPRAGRSSTTISPCCEQLADERVERSRDDHPDASGNACSPRPLSFAARARSPCENEQRERER